MRLTMSRSRSTAQPAEHEDWIDVMRVLAIVLIVIVHVVNPDKLFMTLAVGSVGWLEMDAITAGTRWALPIFVMISGYLLLDPQKHYDWNTYYQRRLQRIAWPLLAWTALYLGLRMWNDHLAGRPVDEAGMLGSLIKGAPHYHLWYLYMLPGLYVVCPFLKLATDQMCRGQLIGAVALCFLVTVISSSVDALYSVPNVTYIDDFPRYLGYFLAGHLLGRILPMPRLLPTVVVLVTACLVLAAMAYAVANVASPSRALRLFGYGNPAIIVLSLAAFAILRHVSVATSWRLWLTAAGGLSFGVYLVHPAVLDLAQDWILPNTLPAFISVVILGLLLSGLIILAMQHLPILRRCV
jgi:surface polysaccharide O-acyltransferase-like enzyme